MGLVTRSANDAAVLLAEALGGDEDSFAQHDDPEGAPARHDLDGVPQRLGPAQPRAGDDGARHGTPRQRAAARLPALLSGLFGAELPLPRPVAREPQSHAGDLRRRRRAEDRLHHRLGLQPRDVGDARQSPPDRRRDGRQQRLPARPPDGRADGSRLRHGPGHAAVAWTSLRTPPSARYTAANFVRSLVIPETTPRLAVAKADRPPPPCPCRRSRPRAPPPVRAGRRLRREVPRQAAPRSAAGSSRSARSAIRSAAQLALERAAAALPDTMRSGATTVDEVQMAQKTLHRARLTNLSQDEAVDGCKRLEQRKIYCSAIQVTAWNTPGAR